MTTGSGNILPVRCVLRYKPNIFAILHVASPVICSQHVPPLRIGSSPAPVSIIVGVIAVAWPIVVRNDFISGMRCINATKVQLRC
jgi:hypothetical protein